MVAAWAGRVLAVAVLVVPLALYARAGGGIQLFDVAWLAVIAAFMWSGAGQALRATRVRERLPGLQARALARRAIPIPANLPLAEAIRRADAAQARALVVVDHEDRPIAIVNETAVMATPPQRRPWIEAGSLARTIDPGLVLPADLSGMALIEAVRRTPASEYLLVEPSGQVFGVLAPPTLITPSPGPERLRGAAAGTANLSGVIRQRRGPFAPGDQVQLTDPKGRQHLVVLQPGKSFHTHRGSLAHDDLIGSPEGSVVRSSGGTPYVALRPLLADFTLAMTRGAAVIYPKDAAQIVAMADIFPGARVLEAGAGSGALSCWLLRAVGEAGLLVSYERRADFADIARGNVERFFGGPHPAWRLRIGDLASIARPTAAGGAGEGHRRMSSARRRAVRPGGAGHGGALGAHRHRRGGADPGGVICCYVSTVTQLSRTVEAVREQGSFDEPPPGSRSPAAGTWMGWRCGPGTGWSATPASW